MKTIIEIGDHIEVIATKDYYVTDVVKYLALKEGESYCGIVTGIRAETYLTVSDGICTLTFNRYDILVNLIRKANLRLCGNEKVMIPILPRVSTYNIQYAPPSESYINIILYNPYFENPNYVNIFTL